METFRGNRKTSGNFPGKPGNFPETLETFPNYIFHNLFIITYHFSLSYGVTREETLVTYTRIVLQAKTSAEVFSVTISSIIFIMPRLEWIGWKAEMGLKKKCRGLDLSL